MILDKASIVQGVKANLAPTDRARAADIDIAFNLCLDDLSTRLIAEGYLSSYTEAVTASAREVTLRGESDDLSYIFALKWSTERKPMEFCGREDFLRLNDDPNAESGRPTIWTNLGMVDGFPTVKFNCPVSSALDLLVYYFADMTADNIKNLKFGSLIVDGTTANFLGKNTPAGLPFYQDYKEKVKLLRGPTTFVAPRPNELPRVKMTA